MQISIASGLLGTGLLILVLLAPLGLVSAYPDPPVTVSKLPWAQTRPLEDSSGLDKRLNETDREYFTRLAVMTSASIVHWWPIDDPARSRYTRVTLLGNYLLWTMSKLARWSSFQDVEFMSPEHVLARGFGVCSQAAKLVAAVLRRNGYDPTIYDHEKHVVVEVNGSIVDGDYGVFIPYNINDLKERSYLIPFFYSDFPNESPVLQEIYEGQFVARSDMEQLFQQQVFEEKMETYKWFPPPLLLAIFLLSLLIGNWLLRQPRISNGNASKGRSQRTFAPAE